ncbi:hypothetical protein V8F20_006780 [Naviculisporaceae sp. PSN 640]
MHNSQIPHLLIQNDAGYPRVVIYDGTKTCCMHRKYKKDTLFCGSQKLTVLIYFHATQTISQINDLSLTKFDSFWTNTYSNIFFIPTTQVSKDSLGSRSTEPLRLNKHTMAMEEVLSGRPGQFQLPLHNEPSKGQIPRMSLAKRYAYRTLRFLLTVVHGFLVFLMVTTVHFIGSLSLAYPLSGILWLLSRLSPDRTLPFISWLWDWLISSPYSSSSNNKDLVRFIIYWTTQLPLSFLDVKRKSFTEASLGEVSLILVFYFGLWVDLLCLVHWTVNFVGWTRGLWRLGISRDAGMAIGEERRRVIAWMEERSPERKEGKCSPTTPTVAGVELSKPASSSCEKQSPPTGTGFNIDIEKCKMTTTTPEAETETKTGEYAALRKYLRETPGWKPLALYYMCALVKGMELIEPSHALLEAYLESQRRAQRSQESQLEEGTATEPLLPSASPATEEEEFKMTPKIAGIILGGGVVGCFFMALYLVAFLFAVNWA